MYEVLKRGRTHSLSVECQLQLIDKMVKLMLLYKSEMWGFSKTIDCLEQIQLRFCKLLLNLKSSTPNYMIYGGLGRFPIEIDIQIRMVSFWGRLLLGKETNLSYLSHKLLYMLSVDENVDSAWIQYLKTLMDDTGYSGILRNQDIPNSNWLILSIRLRLQDQFKQDWYSLIDHFPKALNYRTFKQNFEIESY